MSKKRDELRIARITVAATDSHPSALETIAGLTAERNTDISYVFIEDADLLRAAQLPFALEVCRATNVVRRIDFGEMERGLRERAETAREHVAEAAKRSGKKWSFEVVRERTAIAVLERARVTDVTMFTSTRTALQRDGGLPATPKASSAGDSVVVIANRSAASARAVRIANRLAASRELPVHAVVLAASSAGLDRIVGQLREKQGIESARIQTLLRPSFETTVAAARALKPMALVLPISLVEGAAERIHALEETIDSPIVIVK